MSTTTIRVSTDARRRLKIFAAERDISMVKALEIVTQGIDYE